MNKIFISILFGLIIASLGSCLIAMEPLQLAADSVNQKKEIRCSQYDRVSKYLENLSDEEISTLLAQGTFLHSGYGSSIKLELDGVEIFVKKVPLNYLEGKPANIGSTENLFGLPLYYQYGVGSAGFNVWRELSAHTMSTA